MHVIVKVFTGMRDCVCVRLRMCACVQENGTCAQARALACVCMCMCGICVRNYVNEPVQYIYSYTKVGLIFP